MNKDYTRVISEVQKLNEEIESIEKSAAKIAKGYSVHEISINFECYKEKAKKKKKESEEFIYVTPIWGLSCGEDDNKKRISCQHNLNARDCLHILEYLVKSRMEYRSKLLKWLKNNPVV